VSQIRCNRTNSCSCFL